MLSIKLKCSSAVAKVVGKDTSDGILFPLRAIETTRERKATCTEKLSTELAMHRREKLVQLTPCTVYRRGSPSQRNTAD